MFTGCPQESAGIGGAFRSVSVSPFGELTLRPPCRKPKLTVSSQTKPEVLQVWGLRASERL